MKFRANYEFETDLHDNMSITPLIIEDNENISHDCCVFK